MSWLPIADYALLSDCRSAALVSRAGSVDWLCVPRFDGPAVFARLLDDAAGHWSIRVTGQAEVTRRYAEQTMVLETTFRAPSGTAVLVDALAVGRHGRGHELGAGSPGVLLRRVSCTDGTVQLELEYAPRPEYGLIHPLLVPVRGRVVARGGADVFALSSPVPLEVDGSTATARFTLRAGQSAGFALHQAKRWEAPPRLWSQAEIARRLDDTLKGWRSWSVIHQRYEGPWRELVHHSGRVLQALTFQPTGAIVAAATTSLPEAVGGVRNWDYRYSWVRDACLTMEALWVAACPLEAHRFFDFLADAAASQLHQGSDLQIMFGIGGERDLSERELSHLGGWRASRPVRVGNGAWSQRQLDVYGELLGAAQRLVERLGELDDATKRFLVAAANTAAVRWQEKDQGIWELRGAPRDFVYSKLMCWVALDRAITLADPLGAKDRVEGWAAAREEIRAAILERGWSERAGAYTQAFGGEELDASNLMLAITGFLPGDDPRMKQTIDATATRLTDERGLVYRYRAADGLEGEEGTFLLCTFWLAQAQALAGEVEAARATFQRAAAYASDIGLLAEEVDPASGELLGNFPQAFSHIGLINAAWAITQAEAEATSPRRVGNRAGRLLPAELARLTVILPALNEAAALPAALGSFPAGVDLLVVDNGSTDQTAEVAAAHGAHVVREPHRGFGAACWAGVQAAADAEVVVFVDADGSFDGRDLDAVAGPVLRGEADLMLGSRLTGRREPGALSAIATLENRLLAGVCRLLFRVPLSDLGPFRAIRRDTLLHLGIGDRGQGWPLEMVGRAALAGLRVREVPVGYRRRAAGASKVAGSVRGTLGTVVAMAAATWRLLDDQPSKGATR